MTMAPASSFARTILIFRIFPVDKAKKLRAGFPGAALEFRHRFEGVAPVETSGTPA